MKPQYRRPQSQKPLLAAAAVVLFVSLTSPARASNEFIFQNASQAEQEAYLTIDKVEVREVPTDLRLQSELTLRNLSALDQLRAARFSDAPLANPLPGSPANPPSGSSTKDVIKEVGDGVIKAVTNPHDPEGWVKLGEAVWEIIKENRPVANVTTQKISVLPEAQTNWAAMENWHAPITKSFVIEAKNLYGMKVVSQTYTIAYNYGGTYNGKGSYIANATIIPSHIDVIWGYTLNSRVEIGEVVNTATKDNPVPGVSLQIFYSIDTVLKHSEDRNSFFIRGDGQMQAL